MKYPEMNLSIIETKERNKLVDVMPSLEMNGLQCGHIEWDKLHVSKLDFLWMRNATGEKGCVIGHERSQKAGNHSAFSILT